MFRKEFILVRHWALRVSMVSEVKYCLYKMLKLWVLQEAPICQICHRQKSRLVLRLWATSRVLHDDALRIRMKQLPPTISHHKQSSRIGFISAWCFLGFIQTSYILWNRDIPLINISCSSRQMELLEFAFKTPTTTCSLRGFTSCRLGKDGAGPWAPPHAWYLFYVLDILFREATASNAIWPLYQFNLELTEDLGDQNP